MRKTRKIIAIIMCIAIALSIFTIVTGITIENTMLNQKFVSKFLITSDLQDKCNEQLKLKFEVLEKKSNIPARIFKQVIEDKPVDQMMVANIGNFFSGRDTRLNSESIVDYFYDLCIEYLDEQGTQYNENDIRNTAIQAANIYGNSVGFNNVEHLKLYVDELKNDIQHSISLAACYLLVACFLMYSMYSRAKESLKYIFESIIASGASGILASLVCIVFKIGMNLPIQPEAYMQAFNHLALVGYLVIILASTVVLIIGIVLTNAVAKSLSKENDHKENRFLKRIDNI